MEKPKKPKHLIHKPPKRFSKPLDFTLMSASEPPQFPSDDPLGYQQLIDQPEPGFILIGGKQIEIPKTRSRPRSRCIETSLGYYQFMREVFLRNEELAWNYLHWEHSCFDPSKRDYSGAPVPPLDDDQINRLFARCWPLRRQPDNPEYCKETTSWLRNRYNRSLCGPCRLYSHQWYFERGRLVFVYNRGKFSPYAQVKRLKIPDPRYIDSKGNYRTESYNYRRNETLSKNDARKELIKKGLSPRVGRGRRRYKDQDGRVIVPEPKQAEPKPEENE